MTYKPAGEGFNLRFPFRLPVKRREAWETTYPIMNLSKEQLQHDRINLGRLVRRLENVVSEDGWEERDSKHGEDSWVKAEGMAQARNRAFVNLSILIFRLRKFDTPDNYFLMLTTTRN